MTGGYAPTVNPNKKLYNAGSEWQDDVEGLADYYSTFFREYDPVIGRFNGVDPMSESFESWTTYHYSYNNPVNFNDPTGSTQAPTGGGVNHYRPERGMDYWMALEDRIIWGDWEEVGGGGGGNSRFSNAKELFEYIRLMGTNSINTTYGAMSADAWGVYDMSISEVTSLQNYLGELGITQGYGRKNSKEVAAQEINTLSEFNKIIGDQESGQSVIDKFKGILFTNPDLAAECWGKIVLSKNGAYEYSSLMYVS
jgi:RHS repeat-associated protein